MATRKSISFRRGLVVRSILLILLVMIIGAVFYVGYGPPSEHTDTWAVAASRAIRTRGFVVNRQ